MQMRFVLAEAQIYFEFSFHPFLLDSFFVRQLHAYLVIYASVIYICEHCRLCLLNLSQCFRNSDFCLFYWNNSTQDLLNAVQCNFLQ